MEENYDYLIDALTKSVEKNGEKPLTNRWLLNILKSVKRREDRLSDPFDANYDPYWD